MDNQPLMHVDISLRDAEGETHTIAMPINWRALRRLAELGISPTDIVARGEQYQLDQMGMVRTILIGVTEAGAEWTEDEVGEAVIRDGLLAFELPLGLYLAGFATGGVPRKLRKQVAGAGKKKPSGRGSGSRTPTSSRSGRGGSRPRSSGTSRSRSGGGSSTPRSRGPVE